eukprot:CAMPEP_0117020144 /NCGR_PEP_ID=MMETSP0472-20121206/15350_1 /TAXON_ID=693140 ORGANISM="Tiarina fusus, Strain LIS" /NCGR_SAMPLE_ID=MMETSP0472 /ASSEMBLY_ACC=CAM_ASM_000603 /LENGTH=60 /DNA_ID=CAMNT_0004725271 /DNA_START=338 /DNA_END=520 /DNA_ORIENTATION=-
MNALLEPVPKAQLDHLILKLTVKVLALLHRGKLIGKPKVSIKCSQIVSGELTDQPKVVVT